MMILKVLLFVEMALGSPIYSLQMIVLFYCATEDECHRILEILAVYERGSGKKLTERRLISFLAQTHKLMLRLGFKLY